MPIRTFLDGQHAFQPEHVQAMSEAMQLACAALQVFAGDERGKEIIAARVIDLARSGVFDADVLAQRVIQEAKLSI